MPRHHSGHDANRPCASNDDVLANHVEGQCRVHSIAVRVENTEQIGGQINAGSEYVARGNHYIFGKGTVPVDAHTLSIGAQI